MTELPPAKRKPLFNLADSQGWGTGLEALRPHMLAQAFAGSVAMFGEGQDIDVVVLVAPDKFGYAKDEARTAGYEFSNSEYPDDEMFTCRRGPVNLIVTRDRMYFDSFDLGAKVCKFLFNAGKLGREDRATRIYIHQILRREV